MIDPKTEIPDTEFETFAEDESLTVELQKPDMTDTDDEVESLVDAGDEIRAIIETADIEAAVIALCLFLESRELFVDDLIAVYPTVRRLENQTQAECVVTKESPHTLN